MDREEIKYQLHAARVALDYQLKTSRPSRGDRDAAIASAKARVTEMERLLKEATPDPVSLRVRSPYFIGPKLKRGSRGSGPTIKCFRCEVVKPREEFYRKGTVCKACFIKKAGEWGSKNGLKVKEVKSKYASNNKEKKLISGREHYLKNLIVQRARNRKYYKENREQRLITIKACAKRRRKTDPQYRAFLTCRRRMGILFKSVGKKKTMRSAELMGIDRAGFIAHIESLFKPGMTWENRSLHGWHIDHRKPCAMFDMTDDAQAKECWHYTNLQPLWAHENLSKGSKYIIDYQLQRSGDAVVAVERSTVPV
jgi:hypothetical protein